MRMIDVATKSGVTFGTSGARGLAAIMSRLKWLLRRRTAPALL